MQVWCFPLARSLVDVPAGLDQELRILPNRQANPHRDLACRSQQNRRCADPNRPTFALLGASYHSNAGACDAVLLDR